MLFARRGSATLVLWVHTGVGVCACALQPLPTTPNRPRDAHARPHMGIVGRAPNEPRAMPARGHKRVGSRGGRPTPLSRAHLRVGADVTSFLGCAYKLEPAWAMARLRSFGRTPLHPRRRAPHPRARLPPVCSSGRAVRASHALQGPERRHAPRPLVGRAPTVGALLPYRMAHAGLSRQPLRHTSSIVICGPPYPTSVQETDPGSRLAHMSVDTYPASGPGREAD
jgi:hypothetical protein